jgi:hypothetical protein
VEQAELMFRTRATAAADRVQAPPPYRVASKKPLPILVFLLPLVIAYEAGLALLLRSSQGVLTNKAHETLLQFFDAFGTAATGGLYLGGAAIVVVLLVWHLLNRDPWRIDPVTPGLMAIESLVLTVPLIVLGVVIGGSAAIGSAAGAPASSDLATMSIWSKLAISIGAGLYEELLFRMLLIAGLHTLLVDVGKLGPALGAGIAIAVSAAAFTWYHPLQGETGGLSIQRIAFYFLAGLYFGLLYVVRGFGIVVGVHALYDIIVVSMLNDPAGG